MKVVIIGASTSGLFTAYLLAKEGVEVQVYERMNALGLPPRTLIVTNKLNEILDFVPKDAIINEVKYLELFSKSRSPKMELDCPELIISILNGRLKPFLEKWTRDELRQGFLRMIWTEPRLITLGAKAFLRSMLWTSNNRQ